MIGGSSFGGRQKNRRACRRQGRARRARVDAPLSPPPGAHRSRRGPLPVRRHPARRMDARDPPDDGGLARGALGPDAALERLRAGIRALNAAHGTIDSERAATTRRSRAPMFRLIASFLAWPPRRRGAGCQRRGVARQPARRARPPGAHYCSRGCFRSRAQGAGSGPISSRCPSRNRAAAARRTCPSALQVIGPRTRAGRACGDAGAGAGLAAAAGSVQTRRGSRRRRCRSRTCTRGCCCRTRRSPFGRRRWRAARAGAVAGRGAALALGVGAAR